MTEDARHARIPFIEQEKKHMRRYAYRRTWGKIAAELNEYYPDHNQRQRTDRVVKQFIINEQKPKEIEEVMFPITIRYKVLDLLSKAGFSRSDVSDLLYTRLLDMMDEDGSSLLKSLTSLKN